jgi:hypothetical protein
MKRVEEVRRWVDGIADRLGQPVDPGIKEIVVALKVLDFPTTASCEGHFDHGAIAPWVDLGPTRSRKPAGDCSSRWKKKLDKRRQQIEWRLYEILTKFYTGRDVPADVRISLRQVGWDILRLTNAGAEALEVLPKPQQALKQELYRKELQEFASFILKSS